MSYDNHSSFFTDFRPELVEVGVITHFENCVPDLPDELYCSCRAILSDEVGNGFDVAFDKAREF